MSEYENACPETEAAAVYGGCPNKPNGFVPPRSFQCLHAECPLMAKVAETYGVWVAAPKLNVKFTSGVVLPFPVAANDNEPE